MNEGRIIEAVAEIADEPAKNHVFSTPVSSLITKIELSAQLPGPGEGSRWALSLPLTPLSWSRKELVELKSFVDSGGPAIRGTLFPVEAVGYQAGHVTPAMGVSAEPESLRWY